jgi:hypothetical protein
LPAAARDGERPVPIAPGMPASLEVIRGLSHPGGLLAAKTLAGVFPPGPYASLPFFLESTVLQFLAGLFAPFSYDERLMLRQYDRHPVVSGWQAARRLSARKSIQSLFVHVG